MVVGTKDIQKIKGIIEENFYFKNKSGKFQGETFVDYRDQLSENDLISICNAKNPRTMLYDILTGYYGDWYEYNNLLNGIGEYWGNEEDFCAKMTDVMNWLYENVSYSIPQNHFLNQDVSVNIMMDTGDANYDYTLNNFLSYNTSDDEVIMEESSIAWLVKSQGYGIKDLVDMKRNGYNGDNKFLLSVQDELLNVTTHMNALTFFARMGLGELIDLMENKRDITVKSDVSCGLYDPWNGAGSILEIELVSDIILPKELYDINIDGARGYSVSSIYGMLDSFWQGDMIKRSN